MHVSYIPFTWVISSTAEALNLHFIPASEDKNHRFAQKNHLLCRFVTVFQQTIDIVNKVESKPGLCECSDAFGQ